MQPQGSSSESEVSDDQPPSPATEEQVEAHQRTAISGKLAELMASPQWKDWRWQMRNRIRGVPQLMQTFPSLRVGPDLVGAVAKFPLAVTPYYASLIRRLDETALCCWQR